LKQGTVGITGGAIADAATLVLVLLLFEPFPPPVALASPPVALPPFAVWLCPCCWPCDWLLDAEELLFDVELLVLLLVLLLTLLFVFVLVFVLLTPVTGVGGGSTGGFGF
jgi:hypothetical protein